MKTVLTALVLTTSLVACGKKAAQPEATTTVTEPVKVETATTTVVDPSMQTGTAQVKPAEAVVQPTIEVK